MRYQDRHGNEMIEGMYIRFEEGGVELVYICQTGDEGDLGMSVSNKGYRQAHGLRDFSHA